jgi:hypothetical protein
MSANTVKESVNHVLDSSVGQWFIFGVFLLFAWAFNASLTIRLTKRLDLVLLFDAFDL